MRSSITNHFSVLSEPHIDSIKGATRGGAKEAEDPLLAKSKLKR